MRAILSFIVSFFLLLNPSAIWTLNINRVILASDANPMYLDFWPIVAKTWKQLIGIRPTLALVADDTVKVDEDLGDVIRFEPIPGIPTSFQAQVIRLFLPALFENDGCIISDIDLLPINKEYLLGSASPYQENGFIVYRDGEYYGQQRFPMCFIAAQGATFKEVFHINSQEDIRKMIKIWYSYGLGWPTDELLMYQYLIQWPQFSSRCIKLGHKVTKRIDRLAWGYDTDLLAKEYYIDAHMLRPYSQHKEEINQLLKILGIS